MTRTTIVCSRSGGAAGLAGASALAQPLTPIEQLGKQLFFDNISSPAASMSLRHVPRPQRRLDRRHRRHQPARCRLPGSRSEALRQPKAAELGVCVVQPDFPPQRGWTVRGG